MKQTRARGLPQYKGSHVLHGLLIPLTILEVAAIIAQAFFLARAVTFLFDRTPLTDITSEIGFFFLAFVLRHLLAHIQKGLAERYAHNTTQMLREKLMESYFSRNLFLIQKKGTGHLATLTMDGVDQVKTYLEIISIRMINTFIMPAAIVVYVWTIDRTSAVILVVTVPVVIMFMILLGKAAQAMADKQYETYKRLSNHFIDSLKGLETLVFLGKSKAHAKNINRVNTNYRKATMRTLKVAFLSSFALDFFTSISIAFVAVSLGLRLIEGQIDLLPALTILVLAPEYFSPIKQVGKDFHATLDGQVAMAEIDDVLQQNEETDAQATRSALADIPIKTNMNDFQLSLHDISVAVDGDNLLSQLSVTIPPGWTGVVGSSGSGKTSLINVLAGRLDPTSGTINLGGSNLQALDHPDWYEQIAYIPQQPYIFPLTLADNIRFYAPDSSDATVQQVIMDIGLNDFISTLPKGIHESIGEGGRMLSGGQAQRVAIARALLSNKPIILLDEPTAHLDIETEYEIKQVMRRLFHDKHVILATHRLHWMNDMNSIVMLKDGTVAESGTHAEMIKNQSTYQQFVQWRKEYGS